MEKEMNKLVKSLLNLANVFISKFLCAGMAYNKGTCVCDVNPKELAMGIEVEYEHTSCKTLATKIALDHLAEIEDYYTRLKRMEDEAFKELGKEENKKLTYNIRSKNSSIKRLTR